MEPSCNCATHSFPFQSLRSNPFNFHFFLLRKRAEFAQLDSGQIAFRRSFKLSTSDYIGSLLMTPFVPSFLNISLRLRNFFLLSASASLPLVVWSGSSLSSCSSHSFRSPSLPALPSFRAPPAIPSSLLALCKNCTCIYLFASFNQFSAKLFLCRRSCASPAVKLYLSTMFFDLFKTCRFRQISRHHRHAWPLQQILPVS